MIHKHAFRSSFWSQGNICKTANKFNLSALIGTGIHHKPSLPPPSLEGIESLQSHRKNGIFFFFCHWGKKLSDKIKINKMSNDIRQDKGKKKVTVSAYPSNPSNCYLFHREIPLILCNDYKSLTSPSSPLSTANCPKHNTEGSLM